MAKIPKKRPASRDNKVEVRRMPVGFTSISIRTPATIEYATAFIQRINNPVEEIRSAKIKPKHRQKKVAKNAKKTPSQGFISIARFIFFLLIQIQKRSNLLESHLAKYSIQIKRDR